MSDTQDLTPVEPGADEALLAIQRETEAMEAASAPKPQEQPGAAPADMAAMTQANAELIEFVWEVGGDMLPPDLVERYTQDKRQRIAESYTVLAIKRGWDINAWLAEWGPEIAFGMALVGPAVPVLVNKWKARKGIGNVSQKQAAN